jgi:hypothetical protein
VRTFIDALQLLHWVYLPRKVLRDVEKVQ